MKNATLSTSRPLSADPKPILQAGVIYSADNGQLICRRCAGSSALYTGRDRSGMKVEAMTQDDAIEWEKMLYRPMSCERGCTTYGSQKAA